MKKNTQNSKQQKQPTSIRCLCGKELMKGNLKELFTIPNFLHECDVCGVTIIKTSKLNKITIQTVN